MATLIHTTTGVPVEVMLEGGGMIHKPRPRMAYAKRLKLAQAEREAKLGKAEANRCLHKKDGEQCKSFRVTKQLYCIGHLRHYAKKHGHQPFEV